MENARPTSLADAFVAAQDWWRDAGVDYDFADDTTCWLKEPEAEKPAAPAPSPIRKMAPPPEPPKPRVGGDRAGWPTDLITFRQWWLEEPSLGSSGITPRVAPRGEMDPPLMVIVPMPEKDDDASLLSGPEGRLVAGFAAAAGLDAAAVHVMAALPRHMTAPDWPLLRQDGLGDVLLHYIEIAAPKRVLVLGRDVLPLIRHDPAQDTPGPGQISIQGREVPILASYAPARLLAHAKLRAGLWRHWLDWTDIIP